MPDLIVTGCDAGFFPIAQGLLASLDAAPSLRDIPIGFMDCGLTGEQRSWLERRGTIVKPVGWDHDFPTRHLWEAQAPGYRVMLARPQIPDHFPGYDVYMWIDADIWVQRPAAVLEMLQAAANGALAGVPEIDRSYIKFLDSPDIWILENSIYAACFGDEVARRMLMRPNFNAGMFALHGAAPHWKFYRDYLVHGLNRITELTDQTRTVEQVSLNATLHLHGLPVVRFPSTYNWIACLAPPYWDVESNQFVEPAPPYAPISLLHLTTHLLTSPIELTVVHQGRPRFTLNSSLGYAASRTLSQAREQLLKAVGNG